MNPESSDSHSARARAPYKRNKSTALALALSRRIVEAQGGNVGEGRGSDRNSEFHIVLNRVQRSSNTADIRAQRLLIIQNEQPGRSDLARGLSSLGYDVDSASSGKHAVLRASQNSYNAIALDLLLSDRSGLEVLSDIRRDGVSRESPVLSVSIAADRDSTVAFAVANVLSKPIDDREIARAMQRFLSGLPRTPRVMVVDDDPAALDLMRASLGDIGIECVCLTDGRQALEEIGWHRPDAMILDLIMPEFDGFWMLDALRRIPQWRTTPVFIWTSMTLSASERATLMRSAHDILSKGGGALEMMLDDLRTRKQG